MSEDQTRDKIVRSSKKRYGLGGQISAPVQPEATPVQEPEPQPAVEPQSASPVTAVPDLDDEPAPSPAPAAEPARPRPVRRSAVTERSTPTKAAPARGWSDRGVDSLKGVRPAGGGGAEPVTGDPEVRHVDPDYTVDFHPREKDTTAMTSTALIEEMAAAQAEWTVANRSRLTARQQPNPTNSGFREALLRLGMKHINDPELIDLIAPDGRRKHR